MDFMNQLCSPAVLKEAWEEVRRKGAHGGLDGVEIGNPELQSDAWLQVLADELRKGTYVPVPYRGTSIPKFNSEKEWRQLGMPTIRDKVVQCAFRKLVEPIFEKVFYDCSYAYRPQKGPQKGPQKAIRRVEHILKHRSCLWGCPADIDNFFDSLDWEILRNQFLKYCPDEKLWLLVHLWLSAGVIHRKGNWSDPTEGIPQGAVMSPLLANIYLHTLDDFSVMNGYDYVRYSDNLILLSSSEEMLLIAYEDVRAFLETTLKLKFNNNPHPIRSLNNGFEFLGIYFRNEVRQISYSKERKTIQKMDWMVDADRFMDPAELIEKINAMIRQKRRYYAFIEPKEQFSKFDDHLEKILCRYFGKLAIKNRLSGEPEIRVILEKILWFMDKPEEERKVHTQRMIDRIFELSSPSRQSSEESSSVTPKHSSISNTNSAGQKPKAPPKETAKNKCDPKAEAIGSRQRRATAQKNRYLKQASGTSKLVLTTTGLFLGKSGERLVVRQQRQSIMECLLKDLQHVDIASNGIGISSDAILICAEKAIPILFFDRRGQPKALVSSPIHPKGDVTLKQIHAYGTEKGFRLAKAIAIGKCHNQINLLKFYRRHRASVSPHQATEFDNALNHMVIVIQEMKQISFAEPYENLRDRLLLLEARIGAFYWERMREMVHPDLCFERRDKQNATDVVNQMLNYGYGILYQRVWQEVLRNGLNPHVSFLHAFQETKPTLVYDLVEEFRQPFVDRIIFSMVFRGKHGADLKLTPENRLNDETRKKVIAGVLSRLSSLTTGKSAKMTGEQIISYQVRRFRLSLEQDKPYAPFRFRY